MLNLPFARFPRRKRPIQISYHPWGLLAWPSQLLLLALTLPSSLPKMWTLLPHQLTHSPCNTLMMVVLLAEHSLPCPQVLASAHASGIILSGHSSLRRPSRKRTDSPSSVLSCRLRTPWTGAGVPPQPPARPAGPCPLPGGCATAVTPKWSIPVQCCGPAVALARGWGAEDGGESGVPWWTPAPTSLPSHSRLWMHRQICCLKDEVPDATLPPLPWHLARALVSPGVRSPQGIQHAAVNPIA